MNRTDVNNLIRKKAKSISYLARELGVTPQAIYDIISDRRTSRRIESALEKILEHPITDLRKAWNTPVKESDIKAIIARVNQEHGFPAAINA